MRYGAEGDCVLREGEELLSVCSPSTTELSPVFQRSLLSLFGMLVLLL